MLQNWRGLAPGRARSWEPRKSAREIASEKGKARGRWALAGGGARTWGQGRTHHGHGDGVTVGEEPSSREKQRRPASMAEEGEGRPWEGSSAENGEEKQRARLVLVGVGEDEKSVQHRKPSRWERPGRRCHGEEENLGAVGFQERYSPCSR